MAGEAILIVDDNAMDLQLVRVLLRNEGYDVRTAADAADALTVLRTFRPRLILMDLQLPGMDGLALTRLLRTRPDLADTMIVALTGEAMTGDEARLLAAAGCDGYVAKPIDTRTFPDTVARYLRTESLG